MSLPEFSSALRKVGFVHISRREETNLEHRIQVMLGFLDISSSFNLPGNVICGEGLGKSKEE
jgi:hypothetical protein